MYRVATRRVFSHLRLQPGFGRLFSANHFASSANNVALCRRHSSATWARRRATPTRSFHSATALFKVDRSILDNSKRIPDSLRARIGVNLHQQADHPICIVKERLQHWFATQYNANRTPFEHFDDLHPVVTIEQNFDQLLIPADHVSRSENDTYYVDEQHVLRCHTSAHQSELLKAGHTRFLVTGDVYRCDTVDSTHFPVFHQMEAVRLFDADELAAMGESVDAQKDAIERDMREALQGAVRALFGDVQMRWVSAYFPFTERSAELEIFYRDEWLEVLGCGVMQQQIIDDAGLTTHRGWAFGIGVERIAMALFRIPDIRLFWSNDARFLQQFAAHREQPNIVFVPYSKFPPVWHDMSFWLSESFHENKFHELVRELAGDLVENVELVDQFTHPKTNRTSHAYRITYRHMDRSLTNEEIDVVQNKVREQCQLVLGVELR